jgi:hypothetical protein
MAFHSSQSLRQSFFEHRRNSQPVPKVPNSVAQALNEFDVEADADGLLFAGHKQPRDGE